MLFSETRVPLVLVTVVIAQPLNGIALLVGRRAPTPNPVICSSADSGTPFVA